MLLKCYPLIAVLQLVWIYNLDCITIGLITKGTEGVHAENDISYFGINISLLIYKTDTLEIYDVLRAVRTLDHDNGTDVIILFDYDVSLLRAPDVLRTKNKQLIIWGARKLDSIQTNTSKKSKIYIDPENICGTENIPALNHEDHHCNKDLMTPREQRDEMLLSILGPQTMTILVKRLQWNKVFILYEKATEMETSDLVGLLSKEKILLSLFEVNHETSVHDLLFRIYQTKEHHNDEIKVVVVCRLSCARNILKQVSNQYT
ncbi:uncharacterized protein LOC132718946 [Ruditapes philippinarum]|uniref:uncharacterized protein LOC132718946 n=1 Tax=Ruditapes philippinarum TaxID=129788 RepID=UPI00295B72E5|nr:uncharacterized protein LOC132718946 [Ruditapes philippinarum]